MGYPTPELWREPRTKTLEIMQASTARDRLKRILVYRTVSIAIIVEKIDGQFLERLHEQNKVDKRVTPSTRLQLDFVSYPRPVAAMLSKFILCHCS